MHDEPKAEYKYTNKMPRGVKHGHAKLTEEKVRHIRASYVPDSHSKGFAAFARRYGVDQSTIRDAYLGKTWSHLK
jgi:hypothetical protein